MSELRTGASNLDSVAGRRYQQPHYGSVLGGAYASAESRARIIAVAMTAVLGVGFLVRLIAAIRLSPHVDEASSILAAQAVAEKALPVLPSGTVYFQGATLSYLLQPFLWLGLGGLDDLVAMRLLLVAAGTATVYLCYRLGRFVTGDARVGLAMAELVAIDPLSVQWSGHMRMYGLLQLLTVALVWAYIVLLTRGPTARQVALVVALVWAAAFTHVGAALLVPAMGLAALIIHRRSLFRRWSLLGTLALSGLAPVTLLALNQSLGTSSVSHREGSSNLLTFVGDNLLAPLALFRESPADWDWASVVRPDNLFWSVPGVIVGFSTVIAGRLLLRRNQAWPSPGARQATITLLTLYWLPMVAVGVFTVSPKERYLLNVHVLGYLFLAMLLVGLIQRRWEWAVYGRIGITGFLRQVVMVAVVLSISASLLWRLDNPVVHPNYNAAMAYVAEHHEPGQAVIVALPAVADPALDDSDRDDLHFLAGPQDRPRAQRYTRITGDGDLIDYWVGVDSIVSAEQLRILLLEYPDAWVVVDEHRLGAEWAYGGSIEQALRDMTFPALHTPGGGIVRRPTTVESTSAASAELPVQGDAQPGSDNRCLESMPLTACAQ